MGLDRDELWRGRIDFPVPAVQYTVYTTVYSVHYSIQFTQYTELVSRQKCTAQYSVLVLYSSGRVYITITWFCTVQYSGLVYCTVLY